MALLELIPTELVFNLSAKLMEYRNVVLWNPSENNSVTFNMRTHKLWDMFLVNPLRGLLEPNQSIILHVYICSTKMYEEQKDYELIVQATKVYDCQIDVEKFWNNINLDDQWEARVEIKFVKDWWLTHLTDVPTVPKPPEQLHKLQMELNIQRRKVHIYEITISVLASIIVMWLILLSW